MAASLVFLTPWAAVLLVAALAPLAAMVVAARTAARVRATLGLVRPPGRPLAWRALLVLAVVALVVLAATQPVLRARTAQRARTDAQLFVVLDTSRSMLAAPDAGGTTRLARARSIAEQVAAELNDVPVGVATFTDRVLPDLFPTADRAVVEGVLQSVGIEDPPPREANTVATTFDALSSLGTQGFFPRSVHRRAVLLLTDGESRPFDPGLVAEALGRAGVTLVVDRVGGPNDRVWRPNGTPEANYRPDPAGARASVAQLAAAVSEPASGHPAAALRRALGVGPTHVVGRTTRTRALGPYAALAALLPLLALICAGDLGKLFAWRNIRAVVVPATWRPR